MGNARAARQTCAHGETMPDCGHRICITRFLSLIRWIMDSLFMHASGAPADESLLDAYSRAVSGAVAASHPAVVHIEVSGHATAAAAKASTDHSGGSGSGFFISPDGYLLTQQPRRSWRARVPRCSWLMGASSRPISLADDPDTDLAVLRT